MSDSTGSDGFLASRRGQSHNCTARGFLIFVDLNTDEDNLMSRTDYESELRGLINEIGREGHGASRDGTWRLDTDQAPVTGGFNTQIQLNNLTRDGKDSGAVGIRKKKGTTSATCVLVQNGAEAKDGYNQALAQAHRLSWNNHCGIILALHAAVSKTGMWSCGICGYQVSANAKSRPRLCKQGVKPKTGCDWTHSA